MKPVSFLTATLLTATALLANPYENSDQTVASVVDTGKKGAAMLFKSLGGGLKQHMQSEGPLGAAKYCSVEAYPLTANVQKELGKGVSIKRISLDNRNPGNAPADAQEQKTLEALQLLKASGALLPEYIVLKSKGESYKYIQPIAINKEVCLKCHGDLSKNAKLSAFFTEHYPQDKAQNHKMGDLRGAIVVTVQK